MRNLTLLTDLYQLSMMNGYVETGKADTKANFDLFFRNAPGFEFAIIAGLEQAIEYINNIQFKADEIKYLKSLGLFGSEFFDRLKNLKFSGDITGMQEGELIFPTEPILSVTAPLFECQLLETALLNIINHQTLIATKALKITQETTGAVAEFGLRRAQAPDAGIYGARAAMIGGCKSTSNVLAGKMFGIKVAGTMAHSWIMSFDSEIEAFEAYAKIYPNNCLLLVDTYDTLLSGVPNAIKVFSSLKSKGYSPVGIRLDSGDLAYLSKKARKMLDSAGFTDAKIFASGDIDENIIVSLKLQGAKIDMWGIGTKLITSTPTPALGGVFKMSGIFNKNGDFEPKLKISDTHDKITNPGIKTVYRVYKDDGMASADIIALKGEEFDTTKPLTISHPVDRWKTKTFVSYSLRELPIQVYKNGCLVYSLPKLPEIIEYSVKSRSEFWEEYKRLINPHEYKVDLSDQLYELKQKLLNENKKYNS
ncbi:MAG: nicotinate phosphoribosyltransferase [Christensenellaceae bacterium]|nr:nicotinate phosphoribosyltransferase [Christensenellaceae bacterium]